MPTTKQRVDALEEQVAELTVSIKRLEAGLKAVDQRLNKAAEVVHATHQQQEALGRRMDQIAGSMEQLAQAVDRRLGAMEKALAAAGATKPRTGEDERRWRLHASLQDEARRLRLGPRKLARALNIPIRTVADWMQGKTAPRSRTHLDAIVNWLETVQWATPEE